MAKPPTATAQAEGRTSAGTATAAAEALERIVPRLVRVFKSQFREGPLTMQQVYMLREIEDGAHPGELARRCSISSSATTAALDGLVRGGYCVRTHSEEDRREVLVHMTPRGKEALARAQASTTEAMRELLQGWDEARMQRLLAMLHDLDEATGAYLAKQIK